MVALNIDSYDICPWYTTRNIEIIKLNEDFGVTFSGVLTDELGSIQSLWGRFSTEEFFEEEEDIGDEDEDYNEESDVSDEDEDGIVLWEEF